MKRFAIVIAALLVLSMALPVWADGEASDKSVKNAAALLEFWTQEALAKIDQNDQRQMSEAYTYPYPEYINGVWSTDGTMDKLTFAYVPGRKDEAEAELACIEDQSGVTLVEGGKYTIKELLEVQYSIEDYLSDGSGIAGWGIEQKRNQVVCQMVVNEPKARETEDTLKAAFGDKIDFDEVDGYAVPAAAVADDATEVVTTGAAEDAQKCGTPSVPLPLVIMIAVAALAIIAVVVFAVRKNKE